VSVHESPPSLFSARDKSAEVPRLLTAQEVAELLRVPRSTIHELARARRIPFVKVGRRTLFVPEALRAWIAQESVTPRADAAGISPSAQIRSRVWSAIREPASKLPSRNVVVTWASPRQMVSREYPPVSRRLAAIHGRWALVPKRCARRVRKRPRRTGGVGLAKRSVSRRCRDERGGAIRSVCDYRSVSRRDLVHVLAALSRLSAGKPDVGVPVAQIDEAIGRGHGDMRTPLNLQSLSDARLAARLPEGTWALTTHGVARLKQDRELSDR
jgi:excisionase family DNA binding protein